MIDSMELGYSNMTQIGLKTGTKSKVCKVLLNIIGANCHSVLSLIDLDI